jgi:NAD(P)-dependent dehydrogenase (short-subunit alcohol dehydrogenase family)
MDLEPVLPKGRQMDSKQVVLITGASTGFGRLIAETLARKHYRVFATMRGVAGKNAKAAQELRELAAKESLWIRPLDLDVTDDSSVERAVRDAIEQAGRIDILVNNAGYGLMGVTEAITTDQAQRIMNTNFLGVVRMNRAALPHMRRQKSGLLVYISSGAGRVVIPSMALYCASKFAMEALAESYHYELAAHGIDAAIVQPGAYRTAVFDNMERAADTAREDTYGEVNKIADQLLRQLGATTANPQDIADAVLQIIETPAGKRKLRYRVSPPGAGLGVDEINALSERIQQQMLQGLGLTEITKLKLASETSASASD